MANRLVNATSPYLLLHASNPIDWWEWGPEAFAEAQTSNRPILLSIGYAACHWCHVMAAESFADPDIAELVNPNFVAIKVDRQERPDIDAVFMTATQALTGSGGWPMTVFLTPDGLPFFAGTYYPPQRDGAMPSFSEVLQAISEVWTQRQGEAIGSAKAIQAELAPVFEPGAQPRTGIDVWELLERLGEDFDAIHSGFGTAPKFPSPMVIEALLVKGEPGSLDVAQRTLDAMARGGIHDQIGGGFSRYSVDPGWVVPHFEKMLYDNALLLGAYVRGWRRVPDHEPVLRWQFERVVRGIVGWVAREMRTESGTFASAVDADSLDIYGRQHEGIYYCWSPDLLQDALGESDADWAAEVFHVTRAGSFEHGLSTLQLRGNPDPQRLASVCERLLVERQKRFTPARDDLVVAAWNGWMIDSLVWAALVFNEPDWLEMAQQAANAVWETHWVEGGLRRSSLRGQVNPSPGSADDYGAVALGFARLAGATGDATWLARSRQLLQVALATFDAGDGGFHDAPAEADGLFQRPRAFGDDPTPSGTSALIAALRLVSLLADDASLADRADQAAATLRPSLEANPRFSAAALLDALIADESRTGLRPAVAVAISDDPFSESVRAAWRMAPVGTAILAGPAGTAGFAHHFDQRTEAGVYVCRGRTCFPPTSDLAEMRTALWSRAS